MALRIRSSDLMDFDVLQFVRQTDTWYKPTLVPEGALTRSHARGGRIRLAGTLMPGMMIADILWHTADAIIMEDREPSTNININFQTKGHIHTRFSGLSHDLDMQPGRHNLVCTPLGGDHHQLKPNDELEMLHISIDRDHFRNLIGTEGAWCARVLRDLEAERPFSGIHGTGLVSPAMQRLIYSIRHHAPPGPMRFLLQQSRIMELLALQMEQFTAAEPRCLPEAVRKEDIDKLYFLKCYLEAHFLEELSLAQLARLSLLNEFKLKKGFRQLFGTTVFGYLQRLRMNHAILLLRDHKLRVEEVACLLGYEHAHHFSAAFKKYFGMRPSERMEN